MQNVPATRPDPTGVPSGVSLLTSDPVSKLLDKASSNPQTALMIRSECEVAMRSAVGSTLPQVAMTVERLRLHYPDSRLSPQEALSVAEDWLDVLGEIPPDLLKLAYRRWIGGHEKNRGFWPTPGIFAGMVKDEMEIRRAVADRAARYLKATDEPNA